LQLGYYPIPIGQLLDKPGRQEGATRTASRSRGGQCRVSNLAYCERERLASR
jgi:hypothetical protein